MQQLTDQTLEQMRASTKKQILDAMSAYMQATYTRKQIMQILRERDTEWDDPVCTYGPDGILTQNEIERDSETGLQVSRKYTVWDYYNSGEINTIITQFFDENDVLTKQKKIKHYKDGRQPEEQ
jgi:hypothetical protein